MKLDPNDPVVEAAVFGREVENFLGTNIGRYLIKRSEDDVDAAVDQLKKVFPWRWRKIQQLQNKIAVAESIQGYIADAVLRGINSTNIIEGSND
jgi:hypothetical protein